LSRADERQIVASEMIPAMRIAASSRTMVRVVAGRIAVHDIEGRWDVSGEVGW
jgi:hypothetical protein